MKQITIGVFEAREDAEKAVNDLHGKLGLRDDDISYVYRNGGDNGDVRLQDDTVNVSAGDAVKGAIVGGALGAVAGIAAVADSVPIIGPILASGPLAAVVSLTGVIGAAVAAATGAVAGGIIGALIAWGVDVDRAQRYEEHVRAGSILVVAHADANRDVKKLFRDAGAVDVHIRGLHMA